MLTSGVDMGDRGTEYFKFKQYPRSAHSGLAAALTASRRHYFTSRGFAFINIFPRFPDPWLFTGDGIFENRLITLSRLPH